MFRLSKLKLAFYKKKIHLISFTDIWMQRRVAKKVKKKVKCRN